MKRRLAPLALAVLLAHGVLLREVPGPVRPRVPQPPSFATRTVAATLPQASAPALQPGLEPAIAAMASAPLTRTPARTKAPAATGVAAPASGRTAAISPAPPALQPQPPPPPIALPAPALLRYEVQVTSRGTQRVAAAELAWRHDGARYEAQLTVAGRVQRSQGRITPDGLAPDYFSDKARGEQATHFDRAQGRIVFSSNRPVADLAAGMQDRLSVLLQLAALIAAQPARYPPGTLVVLPTATTREAQPWPFEVEGEELLQLPGGAMSALKLLRRPRHEFDQRIELWLAPGQDYAPVRVRLTQPNGDTLDQRWSSTDRG